MVYGLKMLKGERYEDVSIRIMSSFNKTIQHVIHDMTQSIYWEKFNDLSMANLQNCLREFATQIIYICIYIYIWIYTTFDSFL